MADELDDLGVELAQEQEQSRWRVLPEISAGDIVAIVIAICSAVGTGTTAYFTMDKRQALTEARIEQVEARMREQAKIDADQTEDFRSAVRELREDIKDLAFKLDRLIERQQFPSAPASRGEAYDPAQPRRQREVVAKHAAARVMSS